MTVLTQRHWHQNCLTSAFNEIASDRWPRACEHVEKVVSQTNANDSFIDQQMEKTLVINLADSSDADIAMSLTKGILYDGPNGSFFLLRYEFSIPNSEFRIPNSEFRIPNSAFRKKFLCLENLFLEMPHQGPCTWWGLLI